MKTTARIHRFLLLSIILASIGLGACHASTRRALVIGNDSYPGNALKNARNDATAVSDRLTSMGYTTTLFLDVDGKGMTSAIDLFSRSIEAGDLAILYYAGHGLQVDGENYLVPTDFHVTDESDVKYQGFPLSVVLQKLTEHGATTEIVILDACRNNPFLWSRSVRGGWAGVATSAGSFLAFGTSPGSTASDDPSAGHGLFTQSLLNYLSSPLEIDQVFQKIREDVVRNSGAHQVPWTSSSLVGSLSLNFQPTPTAPLVLGAPPLIGSRPNDEVAARSIAQSTLDPLSMSSVSGTADAQLNLLQEAATQVRGLHFSQAILILQTVLSADPRCALALRLLGVLLHLTGKSLEASRALDLAIAINPGDAITYSYRCLVKAAQQQAYYERDCETAASIRSDLSQAHFGLALGFAASGEMIKARGEVSKTLSLTPTSTTAQSLSRDLSAAAQDLHHFRGGHSSRSMHPTLTSVVPQ